MMGSTEKLSYEISRWVVISDFDEEISITQALPRGLNKAAPHMLHRALHNVIHRQIVKESKDHPRFIL